MSKQAGLDMLGDLLCALGAAEDHAYNVDAAFWAAAESLSGLDAASLRAVASLAVALMATQMGPHSGGSLVEWSERCRFALAMTAEDNR